MDKDNYIVTVVVPVYNHERYIEQAIMSIYNQKTDYKYKVLIGEDKSTDNSREILKKLQKKLPENFIFCIENRIWEYRISTICMRE